MEVQKGLSGKTYHHAGYMLTIYKYIKDCSHFAVCVRAWFLFSLLLSLVTLALGHNLTGNWVQK